LGEKENDKIKWIDNGENNKQILRTNPSEDDLCLKETVDPIDTHKTQSQNKSIMKVKQSTFTYQIEKVDANELTQSIPEQSQTVDLRQERTSLIEEAPKLNNSSDAILQN